MKKRLADAAYHLQGQPMFKLLSKVKQMESEGKSIIHFEIGDPDFNTPDNIIESATSAMREGEVHYVSSMGLTEFRQQIQEVTHQSRNFRPDLNQILVTPGANIVIYYAMRCLVNPGEDVIVPDPGFPTYYSVMSFCGVNPIRVPLKEENAFRMNPKDVEDRITPNTKMIILNSPQNPTGSVMTKDELVKISELAKENDIYIFSDEIYSRMIYDQNFSFYSPSELDQCKERTIIANGFSKAFAMTGWRLGVVIGPEDIVEKMGLLLETTSSCVSPFIQQGGLTALVDNQDMVREMIAEYKIRKSLIVDGLNSIDGINCIDPEGAFYIFPNITGTGMTSDEFADFSLDKAGVSILPGTNFGSYGEGYVRFCCANSRENIEIGIERINKALSKR